MQSLATRAVCVAYMSALQRQQQQQFQTAIPTLLLRAVKATLSVTTTLLTPAVCPVPVVQYTYKVSADYLLVHLICFGMIAIHAQVHLSVFLCACLDAAIHACMFVCASRVTYAVCPYHTYVFFSARYYTLSCIELIISSCRAWFLYVAFICTYDVGTKPSSPFDFRTRVQPSPKSFSMTSNVSPSTIATEPSFGAEKKTFCYIQSIFCCVLSIYTCTCR